MAISIQSVLSSADIHPWKGLATDLIGYLRLEEDWDGYGATAPNAVAVYSAVEVALLLRREGASCPKAVISGDGEIGLNYEGGGNFVELGFEKADLFSFLRRTPQSFALAIMICLFQRAFPRSFLTLSWRASDERGTRQTIPESRSFQGS